jgi:hypothetical protein
MLSENTGHAQTIKDQAEVEILKKDHEMRDDLDLIEQNRLQDIERQAALKAVEPYLDGQEYDLVRLTAEVKAYHNTMVSAYLEVGKRLLIIKKVEGHGKFARWLDDNFPSTDRHARRLMEIANKLEERPEFIPLAKTGLSAAKRLIGLAEDRFDEIQKDGTLDGTPLGEYPTMSRKELAEKIKKLEADREKIIAEGNKTLTAERDALLKETARLRKYEPTKDATPEWCLERMKALSKAVRDAVTVRRQFLCDDRLKDDFPTQAKIETEFSWMRKELDSLEREWNDTFNPEI